MLAVGRATSGVHDRINDSGRVRKGAGQECLSESFNQRKYSIDIFFKLDLKL